MEASRVTATQVAKLACPYCGRTWQRDEAWVQDGQRRWGWCGVSLIDGEDVVGVLLLAPDGPEATVMAAWVKPGRVLQGAGKRLVQTACSGLVGRGVHVIVSHGAEAWPTCVALPRPFLRRVGFSRMADRRLWRLDVDTTVIAPASARDFLGWIVGSMRPVSRPEPAVRSGG